jgi:putative membrane protein
MVQHLVMSFVLPPLFLFAVPAWLARLVIGRGRLGRGVMRFAKPVVAGLAFNLFVALSHWTVVVNHAVTIGPFHFLLHLTLVVLAVLMWVPICGPLPELRLPPLVQCAYLFLMSVIPTIPAAWLTFAERPVYSAYDRPFRLWGVSVIQDQQAAGLIMKLAGGAYLWTLIVIIFFRWAARNQAEERQRFRAVHPARDDLDRISTPPAETDVLTWDEVNSEFQRLGPAAAEAPGSARHPGTDLPA